MTAVVAIVLIPTTSAPPTASAVIATSTWLLVMTATSWNPLMGAIALVASA